MEEFVNEKEKQHGEQKQKELTRRVLSFRRRKMDENTAFLTGSSLSFMHCQFLCIISWSHHFNIQNKNFPLRVILCLHLTKTKQEDNSHGFEKGVQRKERENEENQGRQKMFFGKSQEVKSSKDELFGSLLTKQGNDERKQFSSTLPLHAGHNMYVERGQKESKNRAWLQSRTTNVEGGRLLGLTGPQ